MLRKQPEKLTNPKLKKERDQISNTINSVKTILEGLEVEKRALVKSIKDKESVSKKLGKEIKALETEAQCLGDKVKVLKDGVSEVNKSLKKKEKKLEELKKTSGELIINTEIEIAKEKANAKSDIKPLVRQKKALEVEIKGLEADLERLEAGKYDVFQNSRQKTKELGKILGKINENKRELLSTESEMKKLKELKESVKEQTQLKQSLENNVLAVRNEIKVARRELSGINKTKENILSGAKKREDDAGKREEAVVKKETAVRALETRIKTLGATLQKHFDKNDMKHIKVFEE